VVTENSLNGTQIIRRQDQHYAASGKETHFVAENRPHPSPTPLSSDHLRDFAARVLQDGLDVCVESGQFSHGCSFAVTEDASVTAGRSNPV